MWSSSHMVLEGGWLATVAQGITTDSKDNVSGDAVKKITLSASKKEN